MIIYAVVRRVCVRDWGDNYGWEYDEPVAYYLHAETALRALKDMDGDCRVEVIEVEEEKV